MRKIIVITLMLMFPSITFAAQLFFAQKPVVNAETKEREYKLGKHILSERNGKLYVMKEGFEGTSYDILRYSTKNQKVIEEAESMPQYIGSGYLDALARVAFGISPWRANQVARLFHAIWKNADGDYVSGTAKQWIDAGKPRPVRFTRGPLIQGKEAESN